MAEKQNLDGLRAELDAANRAVFGAQTTSGPAGEGGAQEPEEGPRCDNCGHGVADGGCDFTGPVYAVGPDLRSCSAWTPRTPPAEAPTCADCDDVFCAELNPGGPPCASFTTGLAAWRAEQRKARDEDGAAAIAEALAPAEDHGAALMKEIRDYVGLGCVQDALETYSEAVIAERDAARNEVAALRIAKEQTEAALDAAIARADTIAAELEAVWQDYRTADLGRRLNSDGMAAAIARAEKAEEQRDRARAFARELIRRDPDGDWETRTLFPSDAVVDAALSDDPPKGVKP